MASGITDTVQSPSAIVISSPTIFEPASSSSSARPADVPEACILSIFVIQAPFCSSFGEAEQIFPSARPASPCWPWRYLADRSPLKRNQPFRRCLGDVLWTFGESNQDDLARLAAPL